MQQSPTKIVDALAIAGGCAFASHSCLVPCCLAAAPTMLLVALGEAYTRLIARLTLVAVVGRPGGGHNVGPLLLARRLPFISFASPYLAAARGGRELRYPIVDGLVVRAPSGHLAIGLAPDGNYARLWVDVAGFQPRLGLGPPYILTQAQIHRLLTMTFLRQVAICLGTEEGTLPLPRSGG